MKIIFVMLLLVFISYTAPKEKLPTSIKNQELAELYMKAIPNPGSDYKKYETWVIKSYEDSLKKRESNRNTEGR